MPVPCRQRVRVLPIRCQIFAHIFANRVTVMMQGNIPALAPREPPGETGTSGKEVSWPSTAVVRRRSTATSITIHACDGYSVYGPQMRPGSAAGAVRLEKLADSAGSGKADY